MGIAATAGKDELNTLSPGANYGWPRVSLGRIHNESRVSERSWWRPGMEMPVVHWTPSISPNRLVIYTGDKFPQWQGQLFSAALNGQMLQRVAFDQPDPQSERRESLFMDLGRRFRMVARVQVAATQTLHSHCETQRPLFDLPRIEGKDLLQFAIEIALLNCSSRSGVQMQPIVVPVFAMRYLVTKVTQRRRAVKPRRAQDPLRTPAMFLFFSLQR